MPDTGNKKGRISGATILSNQSYSYNELIIYHCKYYREKGVEMTEMKNKKIFLRKMKTDEIQVMHLLTLLLPGLNAFIYTANSSGI